MQKANKTRYAPMYNNKTLNKLSTGLHIHKQTKIPNFKTTYLIQAHTITNRIASGLGTHRPVQVKIFIRILHFTY